MTTLELSPSAVRRVRRLARTNATLLVRNRLTMAYADDLGVDHVAKLSNRVTILLVVECDLRPT